MRQRFLIFVFELVSFSLDVEWEEAEGENRRKRRLVMRNRKGINVEESGGEQQELIFRF
jgi:hypothetical protein